MRRLRSLKLRIAVTVFVLELAMLSMVLWQTQHFAYERARQHIQTQDDTIVQLLSEVSHTALLTTEFSEILPMFEEAASNPHLIELRLYDRRDRVIAGSALNLLGERPDSEAESHDTYWRRHPIEGAGGTLGKLHVRFSDGELNAAYAENMRLGISIAALGMLVVAIAGIAFGHLLTRRLEQVIEQTRRFAAGEMEVRTEVGGNDEITELAEAFNHMAAQISGSFSRIAHLAYHDSLTGLTNRVEFDQRLERAVDSAHRDAHQHALLYLDLDQFKIVNDTCGHDAGDHLLVELADRLSSVLRNRDTVARLGGDEFGVLLEHCSLSEARQVAEKLREAVQEFRFTWNGRSFRIGVSIGLVPIHAGCESGKKLLSLADMACYAAKDMGRNAVRVVDANDDDIELRATEMRWVPRIQEAMEQDRFEMHAQAIARVDDPRRRPFAEFLLRLRDSDGSLTLPGAFLPAAERFGLMQALDRHAISLAMRHVAACPVERRPQMAFINLSALSLGDSEVYEHIRRELANHALSPNGFCFEITETAAVNNFNKATQFIAKVRQLGCAFALDDFGSGMCSFTYLKSLPVDFVKIDGSFITNLLDNPVDRSIVEAINAIAHQANFATIAEFVEGPQVLQALREMGIDYAQGYVFERPHAAECVSRTEGMDPLLVSPAPA